MVNQMKNYLSNLYARFEFWYAKKKIRLYEDFEFYDSEGDLFFIRIKSGKYKGVVFSISDMKISERGETAMLDFCTNIYETPIVGLDITDKGLVKFINNVVRILLADSVEEAKRNEQRRTVDLDEPHEEREIYEESLAVSEERVPKRKSRKKVVDGDSEVHTEIQQPTKRGSNTAVVRKRTKSKRTGV